LSPFLFDIVSIALHRILSNVAHSGLLKGVFLGKNILLILNLHFADDCLPLKIRRIKKITWNKRFKNSRRNFKNLKMLNSSSEALRKKRNS
jgi:hypothetical protein